MTPMPGMKLVVKVYSRSPKLLARSSAKLRSITLTRPAQTAEFLDPLLLM